MNVEQLVEKFTPIAKKLFCDGTSHGITIELALAYLEGQRDANKESLEMIKSSIKESE